MELSLDTMENYNKNLWSLQEVTGRLLGAMKGHNTSFQPEITDKRGKLRLEKLNQLVEDLLSGWETKLRDGTDLNIATGKSLAEPYLRARRELYGLYLYLTIRCSICKGAFSPRFSTGERERTDFAYLLEQARHFSQSWCVMVRPDGSRFNEPYLGFDEYFGFHLYHTLVDPENQRIDTVLTPVTTAPMEKQDFLTNEGNMKRIFIRHLGSRYKARAAVAEENKAEETASEAEAEAEKEEEHYSDDADYSCKDIPPEDDLYQAESTDDTWFWPEEEDKISWQISFAMDFDGKDAYLSACNRFASLYREATPEVLRGFYEELEEIVDLYLLRKGLTPLTNTDKTLEIYSQIFDGPCQQATRYARGLLWNRL